MEIPQRQALRLGASRLTFLLCLTAELLSFLTFYHPWLMAPVFTALALGAAVLAMTDLRRIFVVSAAEAVIGSHGRLFTLTLGGFSLSIRMVLFALLFIGWTIHAARGRSRILHFRHVEIAGPLLFLIAAVTLGMLRGVSRGAPLGDVFSDANGYAFLLYIPIGLDLFADRASFSRLTRVLAGALAWLSIKCLLLLYFFSHDFGPVLKDIFKWQRTYRLSEVTHLSGGAVRVFAASELFLIPAVFLGVLLAWRFRRRAILWWSVLVTAAFLLSLSRSFWMGALVSAALMLPVFARLEIVPLRELGRLLKVALTSIVLGGMLLAALAFFPAPKPLQSASAWGAYGGRFTDASDAAVSSRWNMLAPLRAAIAKSPVLGSGFGAVISYQSDDPRIHDLYPGGRVTTGAIEWQYLEIWMKMGILGLLAIVWLWWRTGLFFWKTMKTAQGSDRLLASGLMLSFLAFVIANVFTPYVNHPLGWIYLALLIVGMRVSGEHETPERESV